MTCKHNLKLKRPLKENKRIINKEKISLKNKNVEIISLLRIYSKGIPYKTSITIILKLTILNLKLNPAK